MESDKNEKSMSFSARLGMAFRVLFDSSFAAQVGSGLKALATQELLAKGPKTPPKPVPPEKLHASGLFVLAALQREGRLIDFLLQDVAAFSDEEVGAAARVVHSGCAKALQQYLAFEPAIKAEEGASYTVPAGFDAQKVRLTGNVTGQPPFKGTVKHHGWFAREVRLPAVAEGLDPRVIAPAEVELV